MGLDVIEPTSQMSDSSLPSECASQPGVVRGPGLLTNELKACSEMESHTGPHFILHPVQVDSFPCHVEDQRPGEKAMVIIFALFGFSLWLN